MFQDDLAGVSKFYMVLVGVSKFQMGFVGFVLDRSDVTMASTVTV